MKAGKTWFQPAMVVAVTALIVAITGRVHTANTEPSVEGSSPCIWGTVLIHRACYDVSSSGPVRDVMAASDRCAAAGGWLPRPAELIAARRRVDLGSGHGTHSQFSDSYRLDRNGNPFTIVVSSADLRAVSADGTSGHGFQYLCVYPRSR